ncbi:hypothetical protein C5S35_18160 [Candidatus Methanophagaceae archaeon]|jgi:hypothetical protein|nr:hypothetical protein C5S35_18160 [Methanophagales archaeon]
MEIEGEDEEMNQKQQHGCPSSLFLAKYLIIGQALDSECGAVGALGMSYSFKGDAINGRIYRAR